MAIRRSKVVDGTSVTLDNGTLLRFSGPVRGEVRQWLPSPGRLHISRTPAEADLAPELQRALDEHEIIEREILHLPLDAAPAGDRVDVVPIDAVPEGFAQVVLYTDESGALSWHLPAPSTAETRTGAARQRFSIALRTAAARTTHERRDARERVRATGWVGRKILRILLLPLSRLIADPVRDLVEAWEKSSREQMLRTLTSADLRSEDPPRFTDFDSIAADRGTALLVVHGIFSSTQGMLWRLSDANLQRLAAHYGGRVVAFDHYTASRSPEDNVRWLLQELRQRAPGKQFRFDILCHSRGGIVARTLRERARELDPAGTAAVEKIFFVAAPNRGSALADPDRLVDFLDVLTNIGALAGGGIALEVVLGVLKLAAYTLTRHVPGIAAMGRGRRDYIAAVLNGVALERPTDYASVGANYEPSDGKGGALMTVADAVVDAIFGSANDLVVPTSGVYEGLGLQGATIANKTYATGLWHTELFGTDTTIDLALEHYAGANEPGRHADLVISRDHWLDEGIERVERSARRTARATMPGLETFSNDIETIDRGAMDEAPQAAPPASRAPAAAPAANAAPAAVPPPNVAPPAVPPPNAAPAAIPTANAEPEATTLQRDPHADFPPRVQPNETATLVVRLDEHPFAAPPGDDTFTFPLGPGQQSATVVVQLFAPGFTVDGSSSATLTVQQPHDPALETVSFRLRANPVARPTRRQITIDFSIDGISVGGTSVTTTVGAADAAGHPDPPPIQPSFDARAAERAEANLYVVVSQLEQNRYTLSVTNRVPGFEAVATPMGTFDAPATGVVDHLNTTLQVLFSERPRRRRGVTPEEFDAAMKAWDERVIEQLRSLGMDLWGSLPKDFQRTYFEMFDEKMVPRSLQVVSDDMLFPWELVIPHRVVGGRRQVLAPLGTAHVMGRWRPGLPLKPQPQARTLTKVGIVNPRYAALLRLPASEEEATALAEFFGSIASVVTPSDRTTVKAAVLDAEDVQLMHFTGHAQFHEENADQSALLLENDERLTASTLANANFTAGAPILIINACSAGRAGMVATRAGGFAERCLANGCAAVLAAYWEIGDESAARFSDAFYKKLRAGRAFGEALQELRLERADDPTFHAYTFFGDPLSRIVF